MIGQFVSRKERIINYLSKVRVILMIIQPRTSVIIERIDDDGFFFSSLHIIHIYTLKKSDTVVQIEIKALFKK